MRTLFHVVLYMIPLSYLASQVEKLFNIARVNIFCFLIRFKCNFAHVFVVHLVVIPQKDAKTN